MSSLNYLISQDCKKNLNANFVSEGSYEKRINKSIISNFHSIYSPHGTIIQTGITCNKIPCYMRNSSCRCCIVKKAKIF